MLSLNKILFVLVVFCFLSCKKVIQLDLKESDIQYVIEGIVTNEPGTCRILVTRSKPFYEDNQFEGVSGANVTVTDNGVTVLLQETSAGVYETSSINGTPGHVYQLSVAIDNQHFTATCEMPELVQLGNLYVSSGPLGQFKFATVEYSDPPGSRNNYRFIQYLNGTKDPEIFWESDEFNNGLAVSTQLDNGVDKKDDPRAIKSGDRVMVEMLCVDHAMYKYWYSLRAGGGEGSANIASPANPVTNISGGALGYFSAHTVDRRTVIAP